MVYLISTGGFCPGSVEFFNGMTSSVATGPPGPWRPWIVYDGERFPRPSRER